MEKKNYGNIDIFKFIFSIFVAAIHTKLTTCFDARTDWYVTHLLLRLAVPFFFICSGLFYGQKILNCDNVKSITHKYIMRILYAFIFWLIIGLPNQIMNIHNSTFISAAKQIIKSIIFYPWGALWYLWALIVAIFILSKFYNKKMYYEPVFLGVFLYAFALISNSYYYVIKDVPLINSIVLKYSELCISSRNGIFVGILYVAIGVILAKLIQEKKLFKLSTNIIIFVASFLFLSIEVYILRAHVKYDDHSLFIIIPLLISTFIIMLIQLNNERKYKNLRYYSIGIYLLHSPVRDYLSRVIKINNPVILFLTVLSISFIMCFIISKINTKFTKAIMLS